MHRSPAGRRSVFLARERRKEWRKLLVEELEGRSLLVADLLSGSGLQDPSLPPHDHSHDEVQPPPVITQYHRFEATGFLTGPAAGAPADIALNYLRSNAADFGATPADFDNVNLWTNYVTESTGLTHLSFRQMVNGLDIEGANFNVNVAADGRILNVGGGFVQDVDRFETQVVTPPLDAIKAANLAASQLDLVPTSSFTYLVQPTGANFSTTLSASGISLADIPVNLHYVALSATEIELAWDLTIQTPDGAHWYNLSVGADDGSITAATDYAHHASYNVYPLPVESPNHGARSVATDPHILSPVPATVPSPFGWHDTNGVAGAEFTITRGNNVNAYTDTNNDNAPDAGSQPDGGAGLNFNFPINLSLEPDTYRPASVTNLFYWNNIIHDVTYLYGFNEAARNFQTNNYGRGGAGGDAVNAEAQDSGGFNNANFATPPDGSPPRMQMYLGNSVTPKRDGSLDNGVVVHEYGHGISNRLTGNGSGLGATQSGGMGEGWSDWFAMMFTQTSATQTTATRGMGTYLFGQAANGPGIRSYPYDFDITNTFNESFQAYGTGAGQSTQVHWAGTRWASTLWDLNHLLIQKYGYEPNLYNSTSTAGNIQALHLVMNGLKLQPLNPSFIQARDAILLADTTLNGGANHGEIWTAFARRGLGQFASTASSNSSVLTTSFVIPPGVLGLAVVSTVPSNLGTVTSPPASYVVNVSAALTPATVQASDLLVNGIPATSVSYTPGSTSMTFSFAVNPVVTQGLQTMTVGAGAFLRASDNDAVDAFNGTFRFDVTPLTVTSTSPPSPGGIFTLPAPFTYDVNFNEPIAAATVGTSDLLLSTGAVTGAFALDADTARYTITGITSEGPLTITVKDDEVTDLFGNSNPADFIGTYQIDIGTIAFPTPLIPRNQLGSLIYDATVSALVNVAGDNDRFTLNVDPGQTITVLVNAGLATLQPTVELRDPANVVIGTNTATGLGLDALLQSIPTSAATGAYTITVSGAAGSTGNYSVQVVLNAALEVEESLGTLNNTAATAQDITGSLLALSTTTASGSRGALLGQTDSAAGYSVTSVPFGFTDISATGTTILQNVDDSSATVNLPFTFNFYGVNYTQLFPNSNGLITFGSANSAYSNSSLVSNPTQAAIAALWDDLYLFNSTSDATLKSQIVGAVGSRQLILQWNKVNFYSSTGGDTITFQAIVSEGSNTIRLNYLDLAVAGEQRSEGTSATIGIKQANPTGTGFINIANPGPNAFVGSGRSTLITPVVPGDDWYRISLAAGQRVSLTATNLSAGNLDLRLFDPSGTVLLATGAAGPSNVQEAISNFVPAVAGSYLMRVSGDSSVPYTLVASRDIALELEGNESLATAQTITGFQGVLGSLVTGSGTTTLNAVDSGWISAQGEHSSTNNNYLTGMSGARELRSYGVYSIPVGTPAISGAELRLFNPSTGYTSVDATESVSFFDVAATPAALDTTRAIGDATGISLFNDLGTGSTFASRTVSAADNNTTISIPLNAAGVAALNAAIGSSMAIGGALSTIVGTSNQYVFGSTTGAAGQVQLVLQQSAADWYRITLAPNETGFEVETRTPADGTGQIVNTLNPKLQIFDAGGVDITPAVTVLPDGRNELVLANNLTPGATYYVRVTPEAGTSGEYFVGLDVIEGTISATLVAGVLTIEDVAVGGFNNRFTIRVVNGGADLEISDALASFLSAPPGGVLSNFNRTLTIPLAGISSVVVSGMAGDDVYIVESTGALPSLVLDSGTGLDEIGTTTQRVFPSTTTAITVVGGTPTGPSQPTGDTAGDVLNLDVSLIPVATTRYQTGLIVSTIPGQVMAQGYAAFNFSQIENLNLWENSELTNTQMGDLFVRGSLDNDLIQFSFSPTLSDPLRIRFRYNVMPFFYFTLSGKTVAYGEAGRDNINQVNMQRPAEFYGEDGDDTLAGTPFNDMLVGGLGNDRINASGGDNVLWGDDAPTSLVPVPQDLAVGGDDFLSSLGGSDVIYGGGGSDTINAGAGDDYINAGQGNDTLDGDLGEDRLYGGAGNDTLSGYSGNDLLSGGSGSDTLYGSAGNDVLMGGGGEDNLDGGNGDDLIVGGSVANEASSWTSLATTSTFPAPSFSNPADNDAALVTLLAQWATVNNRTSLAAISHDGADDDLAGGLGDDDFCWEIVDILDNFPALTPTDYSAFGMGTDERFGPT